MVCGEEARAERFWLNPWVRGGIGRGRGAWPGQVAAPVYGRRRGQGAGRQGREMEAVAVS